MLAFAFDFGCSHVNISYRIDALCDAPIGNFDGSVGGDLNRDGSGDTGNAWPPLPKKQVDVRCTNTLRGCAEGEALCLTPRTQPHTGMCVAHGVSIANANGTATIFAIDNTGLGGEAEQWHRKL
jgi:hypothetical protein